MTTAVHPRVRSIPNDCHGSAERDVAQIINFGRRYFNKQDVRRRGTKRASSKLAEFDVALQTLSQSVPAIKRRIVVACSACILAKQQITVREAELLRAICDTLDCPLPPLVVGEAEGR